MGLFFGIETSFLWYRAGLSLLFGIERSLFLRDQKSMAMAMFKRKFARTIPDNLRAPHIKDVGVQGKKGQKVHPNFALNITIFVSLPCFFLPWFWYRDSAFCCSASRSSSSWNQPVRAFFGPPHPVSGGKEDLDTENKIEKSRDPKKDISIPTQRVTRHFQGVIFDEFFHERREFPANLPLHLRENDTCSWVAHTAKQGKTSVIFFWKAPRNFPWRQQQKKSSSSVQRSTPGTPQKLTRRKWHLDLLDALQERRRRRAEKWSFKMQQHFLNEF